MRGHLADIPRRARELQELLRADGYPRIAAVSVGMWVDIVRVPPSGTWEQRRADLYGLADEWLGPSGATEDEGIQHLVARRELENEAERLAVLHQTPALAPEARARMVRDG